MLWNSIIDINLSNKFKSKLGYATLVTMTAWSILETGGLSNSFFLG